jgi:Protein of unknown function (DUF3866)
VVGTGSSFGHGGLAAAWAAHAARVLGGKPILAVRASQGDPRERHQGVSHHVRDIVRLAAGVTAAWPRGFAPPDDMEVQLVDVDGWEDACAGLPLSHMGRGPTDDPLYFAAAFAAGRAA